MYFNERHRNHVTQTLDEALCNDNSYDVKRVIITPPKRPGRPRKHAHIREAWKEASRRYRARRKRSIHHRSLSQEWYTPAPLLTRILTGLALTQFDLDPCSPHRDGPVPARAHYTKADNGLALPWLGAVFCNAPYGRQISSLGYQGD